MSSPHIFRPHTFACRWTGSNLAPAAASENLDDVPALDPVISYPNLEKE